MDNLIAENQKVLVFRSTINTPEKADQIRERLLSDIQIYQVDIDLEDTDKVLRVGCHPDCTMHQIQEYVSLSGFSCTTLP